MRDSAGMLRWLHSFLCGAAIGAGAILPGVSGGVLAVVFGIYRPFMETLTHPKRALPKYWKWIFPLVLGWLAGFLGFAKGVSAMLCFSNTVTVWLFIGLIAGSFPSLLREADKAGRPVSARISGALSFAVMFCGLLYVSRIAAVSVEPNFWWYNFCGVLWGMGIVIPGMTSSSIMMALNLYYPLMEGLAKPDLPVLLSTLPGLLLSIAALARFVSWLFRRYYPQAYHGILGIVAASTLAIVPLEYRGAGEAALSAFFCAAGFSVAFLLGRLDRQSKK
jgi:putative membrane protein